MTARDTVLIALFAALTAALGLLPPIPVPLVPVPVTAQTLGVMLAGCLIGPRRSGLAMLLLLVLIALGLPLLSGGRGGLAVFVGPSAGYLLGWVVGAFTIGVTAARWGSSTAALFVANCIGGIIVVYAFGIPVMAVVLDLPLTTAALGSVAFLPGDLIKAGIAAVVAIAVRRAYPAAGQ
ncbi:MAG: biotin transporter BioY [Rhodospirillaceae bacterium]|nr:biotin transporter BioY [Rhodospirillaceae bacterium]MBT5564309.1 biotin transporter BioY [Rhodospirillaceae bacterium]MBT6088871.1 biotin transporter BioY [Rhodospirillaceae bacterium]MBT6962302.1 biotin transporter BioY [Rhodospirillaceae bacterium]MBT7451779.1 biotin transporter BioY [Rhodospirillaceae bacterium]